LISASDGSDGTYYVTAGLWHDCDLAVAVAANMGGDYAAEACHAVSKALVGLYLKKTS
jgi:hypothetical protein